MLIISNLRKYIFFVGIVIAGTLGVFAQNVSISGNTSICSGSSTTLSISSNPSLDNCTQSVYMSSGTTTVNCGTNICFYDSGGPSGNYSSYESYVRTFVSSNNSPVTITFLSAAGETCCDYLTVYNGSSTASSVLHDGLLGEYAGLTFTSTGNSLTVEFTSDVSVQYDGWSAIVACSGCTDYTNYVWSNGQHGASITVSPNSTTTYTVTATGGSCPSATGSITVNVQDCDMDGCPSVSPSEQGTNLTEIVVDCNTNSVTLEAHAVATAMTADNYTVTSIPYNPPYPFTAGTRIFTNATDDTWGAAVNLPFAFCFYGNTYTQIRPGANSVATFDNSVFEGDYCEWSYSSSLPSSMLQPNSIFACYRDIYPNYYTGDGIYEGVLGSYPCRSYVLSFNNIALFSCYDVRTFTSQIVLYEGTNIIDIYLRDAPTCTSWNSGNGLVGIQNSTGTLACVPPGRNTGPWTAHNEAWRFTPTGTPVYTVTWYEGDGIDGPIVGTGDVITVTPSGSTTYTARLQYTACNGNTFDITNTCHVTMNNAAPPIEVTASPDFLCANSPTTISVNAPTATGYLWNTGATTSSFTARPNTDPTTYSVTVSYANGCTSSGDVTVHLDQEPPVYSGALQTMDAIYSNCTFSIPDLVTPVEPDVTDNYTEHNQIQITQSPAEGTIITQNTTVTITMVDECGNQSTITIDVPVGELPTYSSDVYDTICQNAGYNAYGFNLTPAQTSTPGTQTEVMVVSTAMGCDSTVTLHLTIKPNMTGTEEQTIVANDIPYVWNGVTFTSAGTQTATLTASNGCDSVVTMILNVLPNTVVEVDTSVCGNAYPLTWHDLVFEDAGAQEVVLLAANGTDSTIRYIVTTIPPLFTTVRDEICQFQGYVGHGFVVPSDSTALPGLVRVSQLLLAENGCDSTVTLELRINPVYEHEFDVVACDSFVWNGHVYPESGRYTQMFSSVHGCDSIVTKDVEVVDTYMELHNLTEDFCENREATLECITGLSFIQWSTGETTPQITVHHAGVYVVTAHTAQCQVMGRINIYPCPFYMYLPNAITPSATPGENDYFEIPYDIAAQLKTCEIDIFDRWGKLVFHSDDPHFHWDGTHRGKILSNCVFSYRLKVSVIGGGNYQYSGSITVL